jgi:DNA-directed RNA polymerase subunit M/transcription elongation factor TFIIS
MAQTPFCPLTGMLLYPHVEGNKLMMQTATAGTKYESLPEHTVLASDNAGDAKALLRHDRSLTYTCYDVANIGVELKRGCAKCGVRVVKMQQLGEKRRAIYVCICGNRWEPRDEDHE